ncbi:hypothetical protein [Methanothrix harundinacea]|uniref:hypothetical protein n=1 Tax=Methanothrix harundinacea TaxID=301375 RepID=UPI00064E3C6F|nr:hypothetical protein [Methanothrix harundinacea]
MRPPYTFNNVLRDLKLILHENDNYCDILFNNLENGFIKIESMQELRNDPKTLTLAIYQLIMGDLLNIFLLMDSMISEDEEEEIEVEEEEDSPQYSGGFFDY